MDDWAELRGPAEEVAPRLLGALVTCGDVTVRLTEVEAYAGERDPGSHAARGPTPRTQVMFGPPGRLYCYLSYGVHVCANVVVGQEGSAAAVLMRAGEVVDGLETARARRPGAVDRDLARGPGRLCGALGIAVEHRGTDLGTGPVRLELVTWTGAMSAGPRVGLRLAGDRPWRFWMSDDPTVSPYRRHPKAVPDHG